MYSRLPAFVIGFHGCDHSVAAAIISGRREMVPSRNPYDWLGEGIYFWENNPQRAIGFATEMAALRRKGKRAIKRPAVIGAVIDLGFCMNLLDARFLATVREGYADLVNACWNAGKPLPVNRPLPGRGDEMLLRDLDCAVINAVHEFRRRQGLPAF